MTKRKVAINIELFMALQRKEMLSGLNRYYAGLALGHSPDDFEAVMHYINSGGAADFRRRHENDPRFSVEIEEADD
ncbi:MAG TPA: hypothetical protein ENN31_00470 [Candidatus Vogelbacteria bacterium]|nr:hypothetical protein [Candidatus Vogelbacteria bacterium]